MTTVLVWTGRTYRRLAVARALELGLRRARYEARPAQICRARRVTLMELVVALEDALATARGAGGPAGADAARHLTQRPSQQPKAP